MFVTCGGYVDKQLIFYDGVTGRRKDTTYTRVVSWNKIFQPRAFENDRLLQLGMQDVRAGTHAVPDFLFIVYNPPISLG